MKHTFFGPKNLVSLIVMIFSSWLLIHFLAVGGIFLAAAFPLWWLFVPNQTVCFLCRSRHEGGWCIACRKAVKKSTSIYPKDFLAVVINSVVILLLSLISIGVVYCEIKALNFLGIPPTPKTAHFTIPKKGQYRLGEVFPMDIEITGIVTPINAVQTDIGFDPQFLELVHVDTDNSFADVFIQKDINNEGGYFRLTGGMPNPGFGGEKGIFGTLYFKSKKPGLVKIEFLPSSLVLANDGRGTNILKSLASTSYLILPEKLTQEEEELQKSAYVGKSNVLGADSNETKLNFFEQTKVLGAQITKEPNSAPMEDQANDSLPSSSPLIYLEKVDRLIFDTYLNILKRFAN